jgi:hypothetical protein
MVTTRKEATAQELTLLGGNIAGIKLTAVGLIVTVNELREETWANIGKGLDRHNRAWKWAVADWWRMGKEEKWGADEEKLWELYEALELTEFDPVKLTQGTLDNMASVAKAFPHARRKASLSFTHHTEVAGLPPEQADAFLEWMEKVQNETRSAPTTQYIRALITFAKSVDYSGNEFTMTELVTGYEAERKRLYEAEKARLAEETRAQDATKQDATGVEIKPRSSGGRSAGFTSPGDPIGLASRYIAAAMEQFRSVSKHGTTVERKAMLVLLGETVEEINKLRDGLGAKEREAGKKRAAKRGPRSGERAAKRGTDKRAAKRGTAASVAAAAKRRAQDEGKPVHGLLPQSEALRSAKD